MAMAQLDEPQDDVAAARMAKFKGAATMLRESGLGQRQLLRNALPPPQRTRNLALTSPPRGRA